VVDALETRLQTAEPYLFGDWFTAADLLVGGTLNWATEFGLMEARPAIERYVDAVTSRPAFAKTVGAE